MTEKLRELLKDVENICEGRRIGVNPKAFSELRLEILKLDSMFNELKKENSKLKADKLALHDLRENPEDLPKEEDCIVSEPLLLLTKLKGSDSMAYYLGQYDFSRKEFVYTHIQGTTDVIAWCKLPVLQLTYYPKE